MALDEGFQSETCLRVSEHKNSMHGEGRDSLRDEINSSTFDLEMTETENNHAPAQHAMDHTPSCGRSNQNEVPISESM